MKPKVEIKPRYYEDPVELADGTCVLPSDDFDYGYYTDALRWVPVIFVHRPAIQGIDA